MTVGDNGQGKRPVRSFEHSVGSQKRTSSSGSVGLCPGRQANRVPAGLNRQKAITKRDIDSSCGAGSLGEGSRHRQRCVGPGHIVTDRGGRLPGSVFWFAGYRDHPRLTLEDDVDTGPVGVGTLGSKGCHRGVYEPGIHLGSPIVSEAETLHRSVAEVVDQNIRLPDQVVEDPLRQPILCVDRQRLLAPIQRHEQGRLPFDEGPELSAQIATRRLDLYHPGPQVGEQHGRVWGRYQVAEFDDCGAMERFRGTRHAR